MRDYQRMAPTKLTDETLESILWNKAPVELQREVREIPDGSVQELLQRLLRAEEVVAERKRRSQASENAHKLHTHVTARNSPSQGSENDKEATVSKLPGGSRSQGTPEIVVRHMKCFKCHQKGHVAKDCPQNANSARVIAVDQETTSDEECWVRVRVLTMEEEMEQNSVSNTGPTYKVNVVVEGLQSRALVDSGSQILLVRTEMLPKLKGLNNWTLEECKSKTSKLISQPQGAGGSELGAKKIVFLSVMLEATGKSLCIPCYVVDSTRPLWQGAVKNCGLVLGTNAIVGFGIQLVHENRTAVQPVSRNTGIADSPTEKVTRLVLSGVTRTGPRMTKHVKARVVQAGGINTSDQKRGVMSPNEIVLANVGCDFVEQLWDGESTVLIDLNNWGAEPQTLDKGQEIGLIEPVTLVERDDKIWHDTGENTSV